MRPAAARVPHLLSEKRAARARMCTSRSRRSAAAPPALQELLHLHQSLQAALIALHQPSKAGGPSRGTRSARRDAQQRQPAGGQHGEAPAGVCAEKRLCISYTPFWSYIRQEHSAVLLMFETKNTTELEPSHLNQTNTYLGDRLGRLGFIVTRNPAAPAQQKKAFSIYNDSHPRKIILMLSDNDLREMLNMKCRGQDPMRFVQKLYRKFRQSVQ